jgi:hypothetical protein
MPSVDGMLPDSWLLVKLKYLKYMPAEIVSQLANNAARTPSRMPSQLNPDHLLQRC